MHGDEYQSLAAYHCYQRGLRAAGMGVYRREMLLSLVGQFGRVIPSADVQECRAHKAALRDGLRALEAATRGDCQFTDHDALERACAQRTSWALCGRLRRHT